MPTVHSMTGFARQTRHHTLGTLNVEMRTVNHRFLDQKVHLPESMRPFEHEIRTLIKSKINRGKLDCHISFQPTASENQQITINMPLAKELANAHHALSALFDEPAKTHITRLMSWPQLLQATPLEVETLQQPLLDLVDAAIKQLLEHRASEGAALQKTLETRLTAMTSNVEKIIARLPATIANYRNKLKASLAELEVKLDVERLEQEVAIIVQKSDIAEEIDRLKTHIGETQKMLQQANGPIGRRLDFLLQELQREVNTIASKSIDSDITLAAVEMKVIIEQMREQGNNIE